MAEISSEVRAFANIIKDKNRLKSQIGGLSAVQTYLKLFKNFVYATVITTRVKTRTTTLDRLWGNFEWAIEFYVGQPPIWQQNFINSAVVVSVLSPDNEFREFFDSDTYKDASTTADWAVTPGQCDFTTGEVATSEIIALSDSTYASATLTATGTNLTNLTFELRFDGSNWETVTSGTQHNSLYPSTSGIEWRATASGTATLTKIKVEYST